MPLLRKEVCIQDIISTLCSNNIEEALTNFLIDKHPIDGDDGIQLLPYQIMDSVHEVIIQSLLIFYDLFIRKVDGVIVISKSSNTVGLKLLNYIFNKSLFVAIESLSYSADDLVKITLQLPINKNEIRAWTVEQAARRMAHCLLRDNIDNMVKRDQRVPEYAINPVAQLHITENRVKLVENERIKILHVDDFREKIYSSPYREIIDIENNSMVPLGGAGEIGASCFLYRFDSTTILIDCGVNVAQSDYNKYPPLYLLPKVDFAVITHAHQDHIGAIVKLFTLQPKIKFVMSKETRDILNILLDDYKVVIDRMSKGLSPIVDIKIEDIELFIAKADIETFCFDNRKELSLRNELSLKFYKAGHIPGAAQVVISHKENNILVTGDISFHKQSLSQCAEIVEEDISVMVAEGTSSLWHLSYDDNIEKLVSYVKESLKRDRNVFLPAFALGRSQEVLVHLFDVAASLGATIDVTGLSRKFCRLFVDKGIAPPVEEDHSASIKAERRICEIDTKRAIIIASGGMLNQNTSAYRMLKAIQDSKSDRWDIVFTGYASPDSLAGKILQAKIDHEYQKRLDEEDQYEAGIKYTRNDYELDLNELVSRCNVEEYYLSGHAAQGDIVDYIKKLSPNKVFLVHGYPSNLKLIQESISDDCFVLSNLTPATLSVETIKERKQEEKLTEIKTQLPASNDLFSSLWQEFIKSHEDGVFRDHSLRSRFRQACFELWLASNLGKSLPVNSLDINISSMIYGLYHLLLAEYQSSILMLINYLFSSDKYQEEIIKHLRHKVKLSTYAQGTKIKLDDEFDILKSKDYQEKFLTIELLKEQKTLQNSAKREQRNSYQQISKLKNLKIKPSYTYVINKICSYNPDHSKRSAHATASKDSRGYWYELKRVNDFHAMALLLSSAAESEKIDIKIDSSTLLNIAGSIESLLSNYKLFGYQNDAVHFSIRKVISNPEGYIRKIRAVLEECEKFRDNFNQRKYQHG